MKIKISSLGCRLNRSEIDSVITRLQEDGHEIVNSDDADIFIVNSCAVTGTSDRKTRKLVNQARRAAAGRGARVIVTGCGSDPDREEENALYISNDYKYLIPEIIREPELFATLKKRGPDRFGFPAPVRQLRTRVNLKIQDGCDNYCSYCIVPYVRGGPVSKPYGSVIREFDSLIEAGYKEIVLSGIVIGMYESEGKDIAGVFKELLERDGDFRLHCTSFSPHLVTDRLKDIFAHPKMVKHIHLSLQSGSDHVLDKMGRRYTRSEYLAVVEDLRERVPLMNFTTDVIVGFPGETEEDFRQTLDLVREARFSHIHTFRYSPRPGTAAAEMKDTVPERVKTDRSDAVIELYLKQKVDYHRLFDGGESVFLSERYSDGRMTGFNEYYVPVEVREKLPGNRFFHVKTSYDPERVCLDGTPVP